MTWDRVAVVERQLDDYLESAEPVDRRLDASSPLRPGSQLLAGQALALFEDQVASRQIDVAARELKKTGRSYYTIGSAGHENNAVVGALEKAGAEVMVFAETTGEIINQVGAPISRRPTVKSAAEWKRLGSRFTEVAAYMRDEGVQMAVHHHMGTVVESHADVDRLLENSGEAVGLLLDTGHMTFAGGDPIGPIGP